MAVVLEALLENEERIAGGVSRYAGIALQHGARENRYAPTYRGTCVMSEWRTKAGSSYVS